MAPNDLLVLTFANAAAFESWLADQPPDAPGTWLRFAKQAAAEITVSKSDRTDCALAHGWIDGQIGRVDAQAAAQDSLTPRTVRSTWSQMNYCRRQAV